MTKLGKKVIYQIYPKSFFDSNNDGVGDIPGIIEKIDYLAKLNIDMIWFNPFYVSPQKDNGYDIANYREIDPHFGTMADFEKLVVELKKHNIGIMMDMVFNHCSTEHEWFKKALAGDKYYQDYFYIRDGKNGGFPNNWRSKFGGPAWEKFGDTGKYYLHLYDPSQADLDWHNPNVRQECFDIVNFWRQKGVTGFRFDVLNVIGKDRVLVDSKDPAQEKSLYTDTPVVHTYIKELNQNTFGQDPDCITVGEMSSTTLKNSIGYTKPDNHELSMVFSFHHLKVDYLNGEKWSITHFDFKKLKDLLLTWQEELDKADGWQALFWNNHDQPWALNRFGNTGKYRIQSAQMLATTIHLMRGTPYIYMGEELGMKDPAYHSIDQYVDVEAKNAYRELLKKYPEPKAFEIVHSKARDNSRGPMHWDNSEYAGFSKIKPWLMPTDQEEINVRKELNDGQIFNYYQELIKLRKNERLVYEGHIHGLLKDNSHVLAYERFLDDTKEKILVLNNFSDRKVKLNLPTEWLNKDGNTIISNYNRKLTHLNSELTLEPYESLAFKC